MHIILNFGSKVTTGYCAVCSNRNIAESAGVWRARLAMATTVTVLCPNGRRVNVKVTPATTLLLVSAAEWFYVIIWEGLPPSDENYVEISIPSRCLNRYVISRNLIQPFTLSSKIGFMQILDLPDSGVSDWLLTDVYMDAHTHNVCRHHNKLLDLNTLFRYTNLPQNAKLEMVPTEKARTESNARQLYWIGKGRQDPAFTACRYRGAASSSVWGR